MTLTLAPKQKDETKNIHKIITTALETESNHLVVAKGLDAINEMFFDRFPSVLKNSFLDTQYAPCKANMVLIFLNGSQIWFKDSDNAEAVCDFIVKEDRYFFNIMLHQFEKISPQELNTAQSHRLSRLNTIEEGLTEELHAAIRGGGFKEVERLLLVGADVDKTYDNVRDNCDLCYEEDQELTPLHVAVAYSRVEIVKLLLAKGADVDLKDIDGMTPLCCAIEDGELEIVKLLEEKIAGQDGEFQDDYSKEVDSTTKLRINGEDIKVVPGEGL